VEKPRSLALTREGGREEARRRIDDDWGSRGVWVGDISEGGPEEDLTGLAFIRSKEGALNQEMQNRGRGVLVSTEKGLILLRKMEGRNRRENEYSKSGEGAGGKQPTSFFLHGVCKRESAGGSRRRE